MVCPWLRKKSCKKADSQEVIIKDKEKFVESLGREGKGGGLKRISTLPYFKKSNKGLERKRRNGVTGSSLNSKDTQLPSRHKPSMKFKQNSRKIKKAQSIKEEKSLESAAMTTGSLKIRPASVIGLKSFQDLNHQFSDQNKTSKNDLSSALNYLMKGESKIKDKSLSPEAAELFLKEEPLLNFDQETEHESHKVNVPIYVCIIIIISYISGGAMLFQFWEDWDYVASSYFCFITLSTIGFGDIVPGTDVNTLSHAKLVLCTLWLAFGLSLLAMCFNLMQEGVKERCRAIGRKLGLLKSENVPV